MDAMFLPLVVFSSVQHMILWVILGQSEDLQSCVIPNDVAAVAPTRQDRLGYAFHSLQSSYLLWKSPSPRSVLVMCDLIWVGSISTHCTLIICVLIWVGLIG